MPGIPLYVRSNSCSTPNRVTPSTNRRTDCPAPIKAAKPLRGPKMVVSVEQRAGETYLWCKEAVPSARPSKRCEAPGAPSKVRRAPICPVARLPVREKRGVCPGTPKKIWVKIPVFADEAIAFPRLDAFVDAKTSSNDVASLGVDIAVRAKKSCIRRANASPRLLQVTWGANEERSYEICDSKLVTLVDEVTKRKSCLRRPNAEPRRLQVTWCVNEERLFTSVPSEEAATISNAPEKETDSHIVSSSSASIASSPSSNAVEYVNGSAENGDDALMVLADCAVAALDAMEVEIVLVRFAPPLPEAAVVARRRPRRQPVYDPIAHEARLATLRPRADPAVRGLIMRSLSRPSFGLSPRSHLSN